MRQLKLYSAVKSSTEENKRGQIPIDSQTLSMQELLAQVAIGLAPKKVVKNRRKSGFFSRLAAHIAFTGQ